MLACFGCPSSVGCPTRIRQQGSAALGGLQIIKASNTSRCCSHRCRSNNTILMQRLAVSLCRQIPHRPSDMGNLRSQLGSRQSLAKPGPCCSRHCFQAAITTGKGEMGNKWGTNCGQLPRKPRHVCTATNTGTSPRQPKKNVQTIRQRTRVSIGQKNVNRMCSGYH